MRLFEDRSKLQHALDVVVPLIFFPLYILVLDYLIPSHTLLMILRLSVFCVVITIAGVRLVRELNRKNKTMSHIKACGLRMLMYSALLAAIYYVQVWVVPVAVSVVIFLFAVDDMTPLFLRLSDETPIKPIKTTIIRK